MKHNQTKNKNSAKWAKVGSITKKAGSVLLALAPLVITAIVKKK
ncbi:hypothetical protein ACFSYG_09510 [Leeuwenhoekiella polynyae]|uniref:Uncharacterized protein n=1 Tax=Leeuwenhoekiella polynyae TaxID=1550906 RepID=A0A4Q0PGH8_9FLAO|nr:hypothetical protein [Leeuwenhoekiella polynyae]RXG26046.1 hypothetical protein DSM02_37 [Leeuwenhoekiella polynyae]